jgi:hypothetical protein
MDDSYTDFTYHRQDDGTITTTRAYLFICSGWIFFTTPTMIFENSSTRFQGREASKTKREREMGGARGQCSSWNFCTGISIFPPREHNVEQDVVHPHQQTTGTQQTQQYFYVSRLYTIRTTIL